MLGAKPCTQSDASEFIPKWEGWGGTVNGATLTTDRFGNAKSAYYFDGVDDYIQKSSLSNFDFSTTNEITIAAWFKLADHSSYDGIVGISGCSYRIMVNPPYHPFYDPGTHNDQTVNDYTFTRDTWYHYVMTVNGGGNAIIYVD